MTSGEISNDRLRSQKIEATEYRTAREIVSWMGAMQAQDYSMAKWAIGSRLSDTSVHLLPAFDEFLISYKDRSSSLSLVNNKKTVSDNGIFRPFILVNGQVAGLWKRKIQKNKVIIETELFQTINKLTRNLIDKKASSFGKFLSKETEVVQKSNEARGILIRQRLNQYLRIKKL